MTMPKDERSELAGWCRVTAMRHVDPETRQRLDRIADLLAALEPQAGIDAYKRVYLAGHSEGWTGNQMRRDVQHVDAEKGWNFYVENGALEKAALTPSEQGSGLREALEPEKVQLETRRWAGRHVDLDDVKAVLLALATDRRSLYRRV